MSDVIIKPRERQQVVAILDGRELRVGDTVYGLDGAEFRVEKTIHIDYTMNLEMRNWCELGYPGPRRWLTNTHFHGVQVIFWSLADVKKGPRYGEI